MIGQTELSRDQNRKPL